MSINLPLNIQQIFQNLRGKWQFSRTIANSQNYSLEQAEGQADFSPTVSSDHSLMYIEQGFLKLASREKKIKFCRQFIYKYSNSQIEVYFNDGINKGELFQKLTQGINENRLNGSKHVCNLDVYNSNYHFFSENKFQTNYFVFGPKKNYKTTTHYQKIDD